MVQGARRSRVRAPGSCAFANGCDGSMASAPVSRWKPRRTEASSRRSSCRGMALSDSRVRALVADDEPLARSGLRRMLAEIDWIECVGEAASGSAAVEAIDRLTPDLVFL